jgi:hypothetical protein
MTESETKSAANTGRAPSMAQPKTRQLQRPLVRVLVIWAAYGAETSSNRIESSIRFWSSPRPKGVTLGR